MSYLGTFEIICKVYSDNQYVKDILNSHKQVIRTIKQSGERQVIINYLPPTEQGKRTYLEKLEIKARECYYRSKRNLGELLEDYNSLLSRYERRWDIMKEELGLDYNFTDVIA